MPKKIDFLIAKVRAFEHGLEKMDMKAKSGHVSLDLAKNFNKLLEEIGTQCPDVVSELPQPITLNGRFNVVGQTDTSHVTLEIFVGEVVGVLEVLKNEQ